MSRQNTQDTIRILVAPVGDEVSLVERDVSLVTPEVRSGIEGDGAATEFFRRKFLDELPRRGEIGDQCSESSSWDSPYEQGLTDQRGTSHGQRRRRFGACHLDLDARGV